MPTKKAEDPNDQHTIPVPTEEETSDRIRIADTVVASIVRMASLEVDGVYSVGGNADGFWENVTGKKPGKGVIVSLDEAENYIIEVHVEMRFGVELAKVAMQIQQNVREQVARMTMKGVARVDVIIDGVRLDTDSKAEEKGERWDHAPHTD